MKKIVFILFIISDLLLAQISGISGGKLCVPDAAALPSGIVEFEPSISSFSTNTIFRKDGNIERLNNKYLSSDLAFRVTAGLLKNFELGLAFSKNIEELSIGSKYILLNSDKFSFGISSGLIFPAGNKTIPDTDAVSSDYRFSLGILNTYKLSETISIDAILSVTNKFQLQNSSPYLQFGIGIGKWITDKFQIVSEINGFNCIIDNNSSSKLSLDAGFTYKVSKILLFVFGSQFDIKGSNTDKSLGYFMAFTFAFE